MNDLTSLVILGLIIYFFSNKKKINKNIQNNQKIYEYSNIEPNTIYPYRKKQILTKIEYNFYITLKQECYTRNLIICPKVRMEDFLDVTTKKDHLKYRGYIKSRHIDFIICDENINMLCGIELDDTSHNSAKAQKIDAFKNNVFRTIGTPLYRVNVSTMGYKEQITNILNHYCLTPTDK